VTSKQKVEELLIILDRLAVGLNMVLRAFNEDMERLRTGEETVRGNDGVELGRRRMRPR
jgi:hypothetical protein